ncbi:hypothetical protein B0920_19745 [Massilia sp. KIM]|uniref:DUF4265 domain-containing protein n=1 Tax=Massilia sp. KIM TaxID=1955422 RepID=UPI00098F06A5|nr:DUF4265 domain-containing protein [Massilia sp. KIM]OON61155.1 hypothetical protein B0920_19745 [Massilia sp. KIM]
MEKIAFALDIDGDWPPVATEHVWCEKTGSVYELHNAPFFIQCLALGDKFTAEPDPVNGCIFDFVVVEPSGHSLAWIIERAGLKFDDHAHELSSLGLRVEGFPRFDLFAVDVPASVDSDAVNALMDRLESLGFALAFPVWRH